jgi:hypothetical protein
MTDVKYRPKNSEVTALQLNLNNLGKILDNIQKRTNDRVIFNVSLNEDGVLFVSAGDYYIDISEGEYVVFDDKDYDFLSVEQFNEVFEPVPIAVVPVKYDPVLNPYIPKSWPTDSDDLTKWNRVLD